MFEPEVVRSAGHSSVGGVVPLWIVSVEVLEVSISGVFFFSGVFADVSIVVVAFVIAVIDTAVAKVVMNSRVFWQLACMRSFLGGGGFGARPFFVVSSPW